MMEEEKKEEKREEEKEKDDNNLIYKGDGNLLDIYDLLEDANDPVVQKIRRLQQIDKEITDSMIISVYQNLTGKVEDHEVAIAALEKTFMELVKASSTRLNGLVFEEDGTLRLRANESKEQAESLGIDNITFMESFEENKDKTTTVSYEDIFSSIIKALKVREENYSFQELINTKVDSKLYDMFYEDLILSIKNLGEAFKEGPSKKDDDFKEGIKREIEENKDTPPEEMSEEEKRDLAIACYIETLEFDNDAAFNDEALKKLKELIPELEGKNPYNDNDYVKFNQIVFKNLFGRELSEEEIEDPDTFHSIINLEVIEPARARTIKKFKILAIEAQLSRVEVGSLEYWELFKKRNEMISSDPEFAEIDKLYRDDNGKLTEKGQNKITKYFERIKDENIDNIINNCKNNLEGLKSLKDKDKKRIAAYLILGATANRNSDVCIECLEAMLPEYGNIKQEDTNGIGNINITALGNILTYCTESETPIDSKDEIENKIHAMRTNYDIALLDCISEALIDENSIDSRISNEDFFDYFNECSVNIEEKRDITKSNFQRKFNNSRINITDENEKTFNEMYKQATVGSWIEKKSDVINKAYLSLLLAKDAVKDRSDSERNMVNYQISIFKKEHPKETALIDNLDKDELNQRLEDHQHFEDSMNKSELIKYFSKTILKKDFDFENLRFSQKKVFVRYMFFARELAERTDDPGEKELLTKLSNRAIETMNTKENKLITFSKDGTQKINKRKLFEFCSEFQSNKFKYNSLEDLQEYFYNRHVLMHSKATLNGFSEKSDEFFVKLEGKTDEEKLREIEQIRYKRLSEKKICDELGIKGDGEKQYLSKENMGKLLDKFNIRGREREDYISKLEKATIMTYIETPEDIKIIKGLVELELYKNENNKEKFDNRLNEFTENIETLKGSKYYNSIVDDKGNFNYKKAMTFIEAFEKQRDFCELDRRVNRYLTTGGMNQKELAILLLRGTKVNNSTMQKKLVAIAKESGKEIDIKDNKIDGNAVKKYCREVFGEEVNFEELLKKDYFSGEKAIEILDGLSKKVEKNRNTPTSLDDIQEKLRESNETNKRVCSKKEDVIFNVLESQITGDISKTENLSDNEEYARLVVLLYAKFREEELGKNNIQLNKNNIDKGISSTNSGIIHKYMRENSELFSRYLNDDGSIKPKEVWEVIQDENLNASRASTVAVMYKQMTTRTNKIEKVEAENAEKNARISDLLEITKSNREEHIKNRETNIKQIYDIAASMPIEAFSTELLNKLRELDEEKFNQAFKNKKVERNVGRKSMNSIYFSAASLLAKGLVVLPQMIVSKKARERYMPKIQRHLANDLKVNDGKEDDYNENSSETKEKKTFFSRIFGKKNKQLGPGKAEDLDSRTNDRSRNPEISDFDRRYKVDSSTSQTKSFESTRDNSTDGLKGDPKGDKLEGKNQQEDAEMSK